MALTPGGLPYPLGTDKVVDGDDAIHALATAVDTRPYSISKLAAVLPLPQGVYVTVGVGAAPAFTTEARGIVYSTVDGSFTVPVAGLYLVSASILVLGGAGTLRALRVNNLTTGLTVMYVGTAPSGGAPITPTGARLLRLPAGTKLTLTAYQDAPGTLNTEAGDTRLEIHWIGV